MLTILSLDHRRSTVTERARFSMDPAEQARMYRLIRRSCGGQAVFLSTCNRVEIVSWIPVAHRSEAMAIVREIGRRWIPGLAEGFLGRAVGLSDEIAANHLLRVAGGLESQVMGDVQVLGQVREAYLRAVGARTVGSELHRLFQTGLHAGKRIHRETRLGAINASVGQAAGQALLKQLAGSHPRVVVIGAGQTGAAAAAVLAEAGAEVTLVNRSLPRAEAVARRLGASVTSFDDRYSALAAADGAVVATGSAEPIVTASELASARTGLGRGAPLQVFDLSVPANVEAGVAQLPGIRLSSIEDLGNQGSTELAEQATAIVAEELARYQRWLTTRRPLWAEVA